MYASLYMLDTLFVMSKEGYLISSISCAHNVFIISYLYLCLPYSRGMKESAM